MRKASKTDINALRYTKGAVSADETLMKALRAGGKPRIDSRLVQPGDVFFALKGMRVDGNAFVAAAARAGAAAAVCAAGACSSEVIEEAVQAGCAVVAARDPLASLQQCALARRLESRAKVIAVTGSAGKTGVKEMLLHILSHTGSCVATEGNLNNHIGLPLTLAGLPADTDFAVIEAGMSAAGELDELAALALPDIAVITTIQAVHAEHFMQVSDIAFAKAELLNGLTRDGIAVLGADHSYTDILLQEASRAGVCDVRTVGVAQGDFTARLIDYLPGNPCSTVGYALHGKEGAFLTGLRGRHQAYCALLALTAADAAGVNAAQASLFLEDVRPLKGRGAETAFTLPSSPGVKRTVIDESYNASPAAVLAMLHTVAEHYEPASVCVVLGDMLELGKDENVYYDEIAGVIAAKGFYGIVTVGDASARCSDAVKDRLRYVRHFSGSDEAAAALPADLPAEVRGIAVKGSRGVRTDKIVEALLASAREAA